MAAAYRRLLLLRRIPSPHFQPAAATHCLSSTAGAAAALSSSPSAAEAPLVALRPGFTSDSHFKYSWHSKSGWSVGAVMIGQAAFFFGLSNGYAFAQDSVSLAATSEQAEVGANGLQRIEDGSVVSNEHTVKWRIFTDNGREFFQKKQLDKAEKLFQAALLEAKEGFGLRDPHVASALNNLAEFYRLKKEYEKAERLYLEAVEILEESFGSDDIRVGTALRSLGMCYHLQHKFAQAQTCYERALKIEGRVMGVGHPEYASTMYLLAKVLSVQGKQRGAESLIEESIRILEEAGLGESPTCIQRMRYLSTELIKSKRFAEAEIWQRKILHTLELSQGWDSLSTTIAAEELSTTLQALQKFKESEELLERSLAARKKVLPEGHFLLALTLVQLARLSLDISIDLKSANSDVATYYHAKAQQHNNDSIRITEAILSTDQNKLKSTSATDLEKAAATAILLQTLDVVGLTDIMAKHLLAPGVQDYRTIEDALRRCISLYREPDTRRLLDKRGYLRCLAGLTKSSDLTDQTTELQDLLGEVRQIIEELGGESNRK